MKKEKVKTKNKIILISLFALSVNLHSQTIKNLRNSQNFETFLSYFLNTTYWNKNIDSLVYYSSPIITQFIKKDIAFGRYWNAGAYCYLYKGSGFGYTESVLTMKQPRNKNYILYKEKMPVDGFCEESKSKEGIYYRTITKFPNFQDPNKLEDADTKVNLSAEYNNNRKVEVAILYNKFITKKMIFIQVKSIWYLVFFYDCDCSA